MHKATIQKWVNKKINSCVEKLYDKDKYLFDCTVCERCLMFRLAYYLQTEFPKYFVDCEFNKMGFIGNMSKDKVEPNPQGNRLKRMFADIIIHKRNSDTKDNFICLEIKRTRKAINKDLERLKRMTRDIAFKHEGKNYIFDYDFGFLIYLPRNIAKSEIRMFQGGTEMPLE